MAANFDYSKIMSVFGEGMTPPPEPLVPPTMLPFTVEWKPDLLDRVVWRTTGKTGTIVDIQSGFVRVRFDAGWTTMFFTHEFGEVIRPIED